MWRAGLVVLSLAAAAASAAAGLDYRLRPNQIADSTYVFQGVDEDFTLQNGGNIVNTGIILTADGVVVINTGPSKLYGEQLRAAIATITDKPIARVYISKLHPDHFLGNQAFSDVPIHALPEAIALMRAQANTFAENMYRLVGGWMRGTEPLIPDQEARPGVDRIGGHEIELIAMRGHTPGDLIVFDRTTGVLFAGGVVFHDRAPTTPHAVLDEWLHELDELENIEYRVLVPSHGAVAADKAPIRQTRRYLQWLDQTLDHAAGAGMDMAELMNVPIPDEFGALAVMPAEFYRSVSHLYGKRERESLRPTDPD